MQKEMINFDDNNSSLAKLENIQITIVCGEDKTIVGERPYILFRF